MSIEPYLIKYFESPDYQYMYQVLVETQDELFYDEDETEEYLINWLLNFHDLVLNYEKVKPIEWTEETIKNTALQWIPRDGIVAVDDLPEFCLLVNNFLMFLQAEKEISNADQLILCFAEVAPEMILLSADSSNWSNQKKAELEIEDGWFGEMFEANLGEEYGKVQEAVSKMMKDLNQDAVKSEGDLSNQKGKVVPLIPSTVGRNDPCPCGSGKKYKKCHGAVNAGENQILSLRIDIVGAKPPIWRRLLVPANKSFAELHQIIQTTFGWENEHLYDFNVNGLLIDEPSDDSLFGGIRQKKNAKTTKLEGYLAEGANCLYTYDFGDNWEHSIKVEEVLERTADIPFYPYCLKGNRHGPLEDCGGIHSYENLVEAMSGSHAQDDHDLLEFYFDGEEPDFDPAWFSAEEVNSRLKRFSN